MHGTQPTADTSLEESNVMGWQLAWLLPFVVLGSAPWYLTNALFSQVQKPGSNTTL